MKNYSITKIVIIISPLPTHHHHISLAPTPSLPLLLQLYKEVYSCARKQTINTQSAAGPSNHGATSVFKAGREGIEEEGGGCGGGKGTTVNVWDVVHHGK